MSVPVGCPRSPGRPRSERAEQAILCAARTLLAEQGFGGLSVEAVAARAGVGKATIYRRWPGKADLCVAALQGLGEDEPVGPTGDLRTDLVALVDVLRRKHLRSEAGRIMVRLAGEWDDHPQMRDLYVARVVAPRRQRLAQVLQDAADRGEIAVLDARSRELAIDVLVGPLLFRQMLKFGDWEVTRADVEQIVDLLLDGLRGSPRSA